jgi:hypothetical protein
VQAYAAGQGIGPAALADIRQTDPARFRALVNEARAAWAASGEGQSQITQDGAIGAASCRMKSSVRESGIAIAC